MPLHCLISPVTQLSLDIPSPQYLLGSVVIRRYRLSALKCERSGLSP